MAGIEPSVPAHLTLKGANAELQSLDVDAAGLKPWKGVYAGCDRIITLLHTIGSHIREGTAGSVATPVGLVIDLLTRLFSVTVPRPGKQDFVKLNNEIAKEERDALFAALPDVHAAAVKLCITLLDRFGKQALPLTQNIVDQALWLFKAEHQYDSLRFPLHQLFNTALQLLGPAMSKEDTSELMPVLKACCKELMPDNGSSSSSATTSAASGIKQQLGLTDSGSSHSHPTNLAPLKQAAESLLETSLIKLDAACMPPQVRAQIDRTAVLIRSQKMLVASVMNPVVGTKTARGQASLMPILAREFSHVSEVEALLRPRMPFIHSGRKKSRMGDEDEEELANSEHDDGDSEDEDEDEDGQGDDEGDDQKEANHVEFGAQATTGSVPDSASKGKRAATDDTDLATSAKRARASPAADVLPSHDARSEQAQLPEIPILEAPASHDIAMEETTMTVVLPTEDSNTITVAGSSRHAISDDNAMDDSDGSDFEMPELNPDPDTDPEDE